MALIHTLDITYSLEQILANSCQNCSSICSQAALWSLDHGVPYSCDDHIGLLLDCASASLETAQRLIDPLVDPLHSCKVTAELCLLSAVSCEGLPAAPVLVECACALRQTAASLSTYIKARRN